MKEDSKEFVCALAVVIASYATFGQINSNKVDVMKNGLVFNFMEVKEQAKYLDDLKLKTYIKKEERNTLFLKICSISIPTIAFVSILSSDKGVNNTLNNSLLVPTTFFVYSFGRKRHFRKKAIIRYNELNMR
jgi:hypothetical protein